METTERKKVEKYIRNHGFLSRLSEIQLCEASGDYPGKIVINGAFGEVQINPVEDEKIVFEKSFRRIDGNLIGKKDMYSFLKFDEDLLKKGLVYSTKIEPKNHPYYSGNDLVDSMYLDFRLTTIPLTRKEDADGIIKLLHEAQMKLFGESDFNVLGRVLASGREGFLGYLNKPSRKKIREIAGSMDARKYERVFKK